MPRVRFQELWKRINPPPPPPPFLQLPPFSIIIIFQKNYLFHNEYGGARLFFRDLQGDDEHHGHGDHSDHGDRNDRNDRNRGNCGLYAARSALKVVNVASY